MFEKLKLWLFPAEVKGFILMVIFQLFLTTLTFIYLNGNIPTLENEDFLNAAAPPGV